MERSHNSKRYTVQKSFICISVRKLDNVRGRNNYEEPNPKCRLYWCLIEFIDWRCTQSCWYFQPLRQIKTCRQVPIQASFLRTSENLGLESISYFVHGPVPPRRRNRVSQRTNSIWTHRQFKRHRVRIGHD